MADKFHDERRAKMRKAILTVLNRVSGRMLRENILYADANLQIDPHAEIVEFRDELIALRDMGFIVLVSPGHLYSERNVMLTDEGRTALAEVS